VHSSLDVAEQLDAVRVVLSRHLGCWLDVVGRLASWTACFRLDGLLLGRLEPLTCWLIETYVHEPDG
jgi:hypothetical protein